MLTVAEIRLILEKLGVEKVAAFDGYEVVRRGFGYSDDPQIGALQAKLSILLQVAAQRENADSADE